MNEHDTKLIADFDKQIEETKYFYASCPHHGEETGGALQRAERWEDAASAYEAAADASIGHNRSSRYEEHAAYLRRKAHRLAQETAEINQ